MSGGSGTKDEGGDQPGRIAAASARVSSRQRRAADPNPPRADHRIAPRLTPTGNRDFGRAIRDEVPRESIGQWSPAADRPDPIALLLEQSAARVPDLVPIRYGRMLVSPFTFYRGAALVMAADLARMPSSGLFVQACGDAHLSNFGVFATPERTLTFDINDFDETHPAPFEWDVLRLATSVVIAADDNGFDRKTAGSLAARAAKRYREQIRTLSEQYFLDVWYSHVDFETRIKKAHATFTKSEVKLAEKTRRKARRKTNTGALDRLAEHVDGTWRIKEDPPLIVHADMTPARRARVESFFEQYLKTVPDEMLPIFVHYKAVDFARKVVGVGSVGTEANIALLIGTRGDDALFLQMKEAVASVLERYTTEGHFDHEGQRVVFGQRLMQSSSDLFLGYASASSGRRKRVDFYVRQLNDYKASADISGMSTNRLGNYIEVCAEALARAHARSGSANRISGYLGKGSAFDKAVGRFAVAYADQNKLDYAAFDKAGKDGRMEIIHDV
jgi:uncharacterized protein (DUF2252 family)